MMRFSFIEPPLDYRRPFADSRTAAIGGPAKQVDDCIGTGIGRQCDIDGPLAIEHRMGAVEKPTDIAAVPINGEGEDIEFRQSYKSVAFVAA